MSLLEWCAGLGSALASLLFFWLSRTDNYAHPVFRLTSWVSKVAFYFSPYLQLTISEYGAERFQRSEFFLAVEAYLSEACAHRARKLKADIGKDSKNLQVYVDDKEEVIDTYRGATVWWHASKKQVRGNVISFYPGQEESRFYQVVFHRRHRDLVICDYLPYVLNEGRAATIQNRSRRLFTNKPSNKWPSHKEDAVWSHVAFQHPATFDTLAMDPSQKEAIIDDLEAFREAKDYYAKVGKAWKRGYLLYGPPGTGKSTMIAAIANFLDYDVYDLELTAVKNNTELRKLFIETKCKSIIVIEDIDCSVDLTGKRKGKKDEEEDDDDYPSPRKLIDPDKDERSKMTLSGVLNFIDGLWSACGGERILIFTTNNKDSLDPALIRRGRMDKHIEMSYCRFEAFKVLARNFLDVEEHELFGEIRHLLEETDVSPADVAENLMLPMSRMNKRNPNTCLEGLVEALKKKAREAAEAKNAAKPAEELMRGPENGKEAAAIMGSPSLMQEGSNDDEWILDTSSMNHHTFNLQLLHDLTTETNDDLQVLESGSVHTRRFKVQDVCYIQGDARNIISVAQLSRQGFVTVFEPTRAYIRDPVTGKDVGVARVCDCVYVLDYLLLITTLPQAQDAAGTSAHKLHADDPSRPQLECPERDDDWFGISPLRRAKDPSLDVFLRMLPHEQHHHQGTRTAKFFMDSGACHHMTWNGGVLRPYHADIQMEPPIQSVTRFVQSPPLAVAGIGYIDSKGGSLDRVLFVPDSDVNLVSISQLTRDSSVRVVFHRDAFWIDRIESKERIGHGYRVGVNYVVACLDVGAATDWVLDSLSWRHHTPNRQMMHDFQERTGRDLPAMTTQIHGSVWTARFNIPGILCITGDARNVTSVAQLAYDHGLVTVFEPTRCHVKNKETGKIVGKGLLRNGIYVLEYLRTGQKKVGGQEGGSGAAGHGDRGQQDGDGGGSQAGGGDEGQGNRGGQADGGDGGRDGGGEKEQKKEAEEGGGGGEEEEEEEEEKEEGEEENSSDEENFSVSLQGEEKGGEKVERGEDQELDESYKEVQAKMFGLRRFDRPTDPTVLLPRGAFPSSTNQLNDNMFIVDTGACFHTTWNPSILSPYPEYLSRGISRPIVSFSGVSGTSDDGHGFVQVTDYGFLDFEHIKLDGVLLAPTSQMNLLCVGQLGHQYGVTVEFGLEEVIFKGLDGSQVGRAYMNRESHHYVLDYFRPKFLYANLPRPHPNIFGKSCFGPCQQ